MWKMTGCSIPSVKVGGFVYALQRLEVDPFSSVLTVISFRRTSLGLVSDHHELVSHDRSSRGFRNDYGDELRNLARDQHGSVQRHDGYGDELERNEHSGDGTFRCYYWQRSGHSVKCGKQW
jgi:hypothetical protein